MLQQSSRDGSISAASGPRLFVALFGQLRMEVDGTPFALTTRRKTLPLLAYLLLHRLENIGRHYLAFLLWPDETEENALTKLRSNIHELAKALPPEGRDPWLLVSASNVRWNPAVALELDVERFEAAADDPERLEEALGLCGAELLEGVDDEWIVTERERLRQTLFAALERGVARASRAGDRGRAIAWARELLARDPFREDVVRRLMQLRESDGDRSGALADYRAFEAHVRREFGVDPMPETLALRDRIARGERAADVDRGRAPGRTIAERWPLIGREPELERLGSLWARARARRGGVIFVGGEAGIGKSRLIATFANEVVHAGGRTMLGGTSTTDSGPYQAIVESLRSALPLVSALRLEPLWKQTLATLVPELATESASALPTLSAPAQADRVHEAVARALVALASTRPLVVVLEDLHWASAATVNALRALARRIALEPILVVVTYRDDELERTHPLATAIRELARDGLGETLALRALALEDVVEMARRVGIRAEAAAAVHRTTGGNAFFVTEILANETPGTVVPVGVREAVAARFERLPDAARRLAAIAAVAGTNFSRAMLGEVGGSDVADVVDALDALIDRRFVCERLGRGPLHLGFSHELVRATILDLAPSTPECHYRVAVALETCHPELESDLALELAVHYERAGKNVEAAQRYAAAARRALALGAVAEADATIARGLAVEVDARTRADLLRIAIEIASRGDIDGLLARIERLEAAADELGDDGLRVFALAARAEHLMLVGDMRRVAESAERLRARADDCGEPLWIAVAAFIDAHRRSEVGDIAGAIELARGSLTTFRTLGETVWADKCRYVLARLAVRNGDVETARRLCAELEATADGAHYGSKLRATVAGYATTIEFGTGAEASAVAARWVATACEAGDRREESRARDGYARALLLAGRGGAAMVQSELAVELAESTGLAGGANRAELLHFATNALKFGDFSRAIEGLEAIVAQRRAAQTSYALMFPLSMLGLARAYAGDAARGHDAGWEAVEIAARLVLPTRRAVALKHLAEIALYAREYSAALDYATESLALRDAHAMAAATKSALPAALSAARLGKIDEARRFLARIPTGEDDVFHGEYWRERAALRLAHTAHLCDDRAGSERWLTVAERELAATLDELAEPWRSHYLSAWWSKEIAEARAGRWQEPAR